MLALLNSPLAVLYIAMTKYFILVLIALHKVSIYTGVSNFAFGYMSQFLSELFFKKIMSCVSEPALLFCRLIGALAKFGSC